MDKHKAGILDGFQIRELMKDAAFDETLSEVELSVWQSLLSLLTNILGNYQTAEFVKEIEELLMSFRQLRARISVKLHFLQSHLEYFLMKC